MEAGLTHSKLQRASHPSTQPNAGLVSLFRQHATRKFRDFSVRQVPELLRSRYRSGWRQTNVVMVMRPAGSQRSPTESNSGKTIACFGESIHGHISRHDYARHLKPSALLPERAARSFRRSGSGARPQCARYRSRQLRQSTSYPVKRLTSRYGSLNRSLEKVQTPSVLSVDAVQALPGR